MCRETYYLNLTHDTSLTAVDDAMKATVADMLSLLVDQPVTVVTAVVVSVVSLSATRRYRRWQPGRTQYAPHPLQWRRLSVTRVSLCGSKRIRPSAVQGRV